MSFALPRPLRGAKGAISRSRSAREVPRRWIRLLGTRRASRVCADLRHSFGSFAVMDGGSTWSENCLVLSKPALRKCTHTSPTTRFVLRLKLPPVGIARARTAADGEDGGK